MSKSLPYLHSLQMIGLFTSLILFVQAVVFFEDVVDNVGNRAVTGIRLDLDLIKGLLVQVNRLLDSLLFALTGFFAIAHSPGRYILVN